MIFSKAYELSKSGTEFVMVTLLEVKGSAPQEVGAKCIVTSEGLETGTVGGGKVEARAIEYAQELISNKDTISIIKEWNLQTDIGMTCGGVVKFLFEYHQTSSWDIAIFGAGHVSQALTRVLSKLDCNITVIDSREEWLLKLDNDIKIINSNDAKASVAKFTEKTFFLSITKGHAFDVPFLVEIYRQFPNAPYVGAIGSKSKRNAIIKDLKEANVSDEFIEKLRIPIGLPLGNNTPEEISISIAAQLLQERDLVL